MGVGELGGAIKSRSLNRSWPVRWRKNCQLVYSGSALKSALYDGDER